MGQNTVDVEFKDGLVTMDGEVVCGYDATEEGFIIKPFQGPEAPLTVCGYAA